MVVQITQKLNFFIRVVDALLECFDLNICKLLQTDFDGLNILK